ncbi:MAG: glycosyltransferase [Rhodobiaceae bacterium]|nr:glycosyltransferase [Rhodobiaceae bacterium]MCC0055534.1 glycosyltransferase [Rhodobiaceae bacterium]
MRPLRILMTNNTLAGRAGSELYVRDLALALLRRGHSPIAYSARLGEVAREMKALTIPVIDDLRDMAAAPDIIHGQHHLETMTAVLSYPSTPALFVCHGWKPWQEAPPVHPNILRYVAVDDLCRERLLTTRGIVPQATETIYNFVDLERFAQRRDLPDRPRRALVFSNVQQAIPEPVRRACAAAGIETVDIIGAKAGTAVAEPGTVLAGYDIVFAKARAAIEAAASGCAVIVMDQDGLAGMVTSANFDELRRLNFGVRSLQTNAITETTLARQIALYDRRDALAVSDRMRAEGNMGIAIDAWLRVYDAVLSDWEQASAAIDDRSRMRAAADYLRTLYGPLKSRDEVQAQHRRSEEENRALRRQLDGMRGSRIWKLAERYERLRTRLTGR